MDYLHKFNNRIQKFMYAVNTYEQCMEHELMAAVNDFNKIIKKSTSHARLPWIRPSYRLRR